MTLLYTIIQVLTDMLLENGYSLAIAQLHVF